MIKITRFFYVHWLLVPLFVLSYVAGGLYTLLTAYAVVTIHELFHLFAALLTKERTGTLLLLPFGISLRLSSSIIKKPGKEIVIAIAGPLSNALMLSLCPLLEAHYGAGPALSLFRIVNLTVLCVNLLPCLPLDGGRILRSVLVMQMGYQDANHYMKKLSRAIIVSLFCLCLLCLLFGGLHISLLIVGGFLVVHLAEEKRQNEYTMMQELIYHKEKLRQKGLMRSRVISVLGTTPARDVFKLFSYDCYYVIVLLNQRQEPIRFITESQFVDAIIKKGFHISLCEI